MKLAVGRERDSQNDGTHNGMHDPSKCGAVYTTQILRRQKAETAADCRTKCSHRPGSGLVSATVCITNSREQTRDRNDPKSGLFFLATNCDTDGKLCHNSSQENARSKWRKALTHIAKSAQKRLRAVPAKSKTTYAGPHACLKVLTVHVEKYSERSWSRGELSQQFTAEAREN